MVKSELQSKLKRAIMQGEGRERKESPKALHVETHKKLQNGRERGEKGVFGVE